MSLKAYYYMLLSLYDHIYNIYSSISDMKNKKLLHTIYENIKIITDKNGIFILLEKGLDEKDKNIVIHHITLSIGIILGILEGNDDILDLFPEKIEFIDENEKIATIKRKELKSCLIELDKIVETHFSNISICSSNFSKLEKLTDTCDIISTFLIAENGVNLEYCKLFGYINCVLALYHSFISNYAIYNFNITNEMKKQISFYIGLSIGIMNANHFENKIILESLLLLQEEIKTFF